MGSRSSPSRATISPQPPPPDQPGRHQNLAITLVRRPETLRGDVVALVEKGLEGVQDDLHVVGHGSASSISLMIDDAGRELSTASAQLVWRDRKDHFLRIGQVLD